MVTAVAFRTQLRDGKALQHMYLNEAKLTSGIAEFRSAIVHPERIEPEKVIGFGRDAAENFSLNVMVWNWYTCGRD
jgi:hypothetical protein